MKIKLLLFLVVYMGIHTGMSLRAQSVPDTTTFSLQDVTAVTGGTSLAGAFFNSVDSYFDPAYKGTKNSLLNFRNYTVSTPTYYTYWLSSGNYSSSSEICNALTINFNTPVYSADAALSVGSQLYSNTALRNSTQQTLPLGEAQSVQEAQNMLSGPRKAIR